jgi:hypothetical protein
MVTAWAKDPLDEHRILSRALVSLFRFRGLPNDITAEHLPNQPADILFKIAQPDSAVSANDIWSVLDNEMRPFVDVIATLAIFPFESELFPLVRSVDITLVQRQQRQPQGPALDAASLLREPSGGPKPAPAVVDGKATAATGDGSAKGLRLPVRIQQVPNGKTPAAKRTTPPWPPAEGAEGGGKPGGSAPDAGKGGEGKGTQPPSSTNKKGGKGER